MLLLLIFAFIAGAATAITPCVLPVLPALLSASGTGGRRRPLGIVCGLALTYTITIIGIASLVDGVGIADGTLRTAAIVVLALFGVTLLVPAAGHWVAERLSFLARFAPRSAGEGFWSGLPVGGALGFVYAPCAGPILGGVISVSATQGTTWKIAALGIKVSRHCTYHGVALNVAMDLRPFDGINPCGYEGLRTVDLSTIGVQASMDEAAEVLGHSLRSRLSP